MQSLKGVKTTAKTYRVSGYVVEPNADNWNGTDIVAILDRYTDTLNNLKVEESPTWEWDDDCPENHFDLTDEMCEIRFVKEDVNENL